jgi:large conductance mechanosensitive channel
MLKGFKNFLMRGDVIVVAVGLVVALAFSNLVKAFTDDIINPLIAAVQPGNLGPGLGWQLVKGGGDGTFLNLGGFISAIIYFIVFSRLFPDHPALQDRHGPTGQGCVW